MRDPRKRLSIIISSSWWKKKKRRSNTTLNWESKEKILRRIKVKGGRIEKIKIKGRLDTSIIRIRKLKKTAWGGGGEKALIRERRVWLSIIKRKGGVG